MNTPTPIPTPATPGTPGPPGPPDRNPPPPTVGRGVDGSLGPVLTDRSGRLT